MSMSQLANCNSDKTEKYADTKSDYYKLAYRCQLLSN